MDLRRLRAGEWIAALSGAALIVSLFLPWYRGHAGRSAWQAFSVLDGVFFAGGLLGLAVLVVTASQRTVAVPIALTSLTTLVELVVLVLVAVRVAFPPGDGLARRGGLWLGLAGALGLAAGALLAMRDERLSKPGRPTDATGRPAPPPPEIEPIPAPRP